MKQNLLINRLLILVLSVSFSTVVVGAPSWSYTNTTPNMSFIYITTASNITINGSPITAGDYIGVFYNLNGGGYGCAGFISYTPVTGSNFLILTAYGTQPGLNNGLAVGEAFKFKVWRHTDGLEGGPVTATYSSGTGTYLQFQSSYIATLAFTITVPFVATATPTAASCYGICNGSISLTVSGALTPYTYAWSNGATTQNLNNLCAGTYTVTVSDNTGTPQTTTATATVNQPAALTITGVISQYGSYNVSANGATDGYINLTVTGGPTTSYTYLWSGGATTQNRSNLGEGTYSVTVTSSQCTATASFTLTQPPSLQATITGTNVSCYGQCNGSASLTVSLGVTPYHYLWSNGATTQNLYDLCPGIYSVTVTDSNGSNIGPMPWTYVVTSGNHTILIQTGVVTISGNPISIGDYVGVFYSVSGTLYCGGFQSWQGINTALAAWGDDTNTPEQDGFTNGQAFNWKLWDASTGQIINMTATYQTGGGFPNQGNYATNGMSGLATLTGTLPPPLLPNTTTASVTITQPDAMVLNGTTSPQTSVSLGSVDITVSGGSPSYTFWWSNGASSEDLASVPAGTYSVTVMDSNQCTVTGSFVVEQQACMAILTASIVNVNCYGGNTGSIDLTVTGGSEPYYYSWSNGANTEDLVNVPAGTYSVTVNYSGNCIVTGSFTVAQPEQALSAVLTIQDASCFGLCDGILVITVYGGTGPYSVSTNGEIKYVSPYSFSGLCAGSYNVTITDTKGCQEIYPYMINQPLPLNITGIITNVQCNANATGAVDITVTGGTNPYSFLWSNGAITEDLNGVQAGIYCVTVTDSKNCSVNTCFTVNQPPLLTATSFATPILCNGGTSIVTIGAQGGTLPYMGTGNFEVPTGTYSYTVTDFHGCTATTSVTIAEPSFFDITVDYTPIACNGGTSTVTITAQGGTPQYEYMDSFFDVFYQIEMGAGPHFIEVTDANGCIAETQINIPEPTALVVGTFVIDVSCYNNCDGIVVISPFNGTPPYQVYLTDIVGNSYPNYTYWWDFIFEGLCAGIYYGEVVDANGCVYTLTITVNQSPELIVDGEPAEIPALKCFGDSDGAIILNVSGGVEPYSYLWSNGETLQNISGLIAGNYTVTVTDQNQCTATNQINITEPPVLEISVSYTPILCNGGSSTVSISATGGTPDYGYWVDSFFDIFTEVTVGAGPHVIQVVDANGCEAEIQINIPEPPALVVGVQYTPILCHGGTSTVTIAAQGGTPQYEYMDSFFDIFFQIEMSAGPHMIEVTDANGCVATEQINITEPSFFDVWADFTPIPCNGGTSIVTITAQGGTPQYEYMDSFFDIFFQIEMSAGPHMIEVTDANGCVATEQINIAEPSFFDVWAEYTPILCNGGTSTVTLHAQGGTPPYWYAGDSFFDIFVEIDIPSGNHFVEITDSHGCVATAEIFIPEPEELTLSFTPDPPTWGGAPGTYGLHNVSCYGGYDGWINKTVTGGTPPYTWEWSDGFTATGTSVCNVGLPAGEYSVTVTDANGCTIVENDIITEPPELILVLTYTPVPCYGGTSTVTIYAQGGTTPYSFVWFDGFISRSVGQPGISSLEVQTIQVPAGEHSFTVTDANGCTAIESIIITEPPELTLGFTPDPTGWGGAPGTYGLHNVSCYGGYDGWINKTVTGGTPPYTWEWSDGFTATGTSVCNVGLPAGTYSLTVTDANGCTVVENDIITEPPELTLVVTYTPIPCNGGTSTVTLHAQGGTPPYWYAGDSFFDIFVEVDIPTGNHFVEITDSHGCVSTAEIFIPEPEELTLSFTPDPAGWGGAPGTYGLHNVSCYGGYDGWINKTVTGGTPPYTWEWSDGFTATGTSVCNVGLPAGEYSVTVTDANGCTIVEDDIITEPPELILVLTYTPIPCYGGTSTVTLHAQGGTPPYMYVADSFFDIFVEVDIPTGNHFVEITDSHGCVATAEIFIPEPEELTLSFTPDPANWPGAQGTYGLHNVSCYGGYDGWINKTVTGGIPPYTWEWSDGFTATGTSVCNVGLPAGTYTVTVTDANGCIIIETDAINEPPELIVNATATPILCHEGTSTVTLHAQGGTPQYEYAGSFFDVYFDITITDVDAGIHSFTITDANGCIATTEINIPEPPPLTAEIITTDVSCYGDCDGTILVNPSGGTPPYIIAINGPGNEEYVTEYWWDLDGQPWCGGIYQVIVTDANGCVYTENVTVGEPAPIVLTVSAGEILCNGGMSTIIMIIQGGIYGYDTEMITATGDPVPAAVISGNGTGYVTASVPAGLYTIIVTDANGCVKEEEINISEPSFFDIWVEYTPILCHGGSSIVTVHGQGGVEPYELEDHYTFIIETTFETYVGQHLIHVTDANGCIAEEQINIPEPPALEIGVQYTPILCNGGTSTISISATGGTPDYGYWVDSFFDIFTEVTVGAGTHFIQVVDANGCTAEVLIYIPEPPVLTAEIQITDATCAGTCDGIILVNPSGGTSPYIVEIQGSGNEEYITEYWWDLDGQPWCDGTYQVIVTDANGCVYSQTVIINQPPEFMISVSTTNVSCFGADDGTITIQANGGTPPYTYEGNSFFDVFTEVSVPAGPHMILVTDANQCQKEEQVIISQPPVFEIWAEYTPILCNGGLSTVTLHGQGGTPPYWYAGDSFFDIFFQIDIPPGNHTYEVTDSNNCLATAQINIPQPPALEASVYVLDVSCNNDCDGVIGIGPYNGTPPYQVYLTDILGNNYSGYTYWWDFVFDGLCSGTYYGNVVDANGCEYSLTATVSQPSILSLSAAVTDVSCHGANDGTATITVTGGTPPYEETDPGIVLSGYLNLGDYIVTDIYPITATDTLIGYWNMLPPGNYIYTVSDANGCTATITFTINEPEELTVTVSATPVLCNGGTSTITITPQGGTTPYTYLGSFFDIYIEVVIPAGYHYVEIADANGCIATAEIYIVEPPHLTVDVQTADVSCYGDCDGGISVIPSGGTPPYMAYRCPVNINTAAPSFDPDTDCGDAITAYLYEWLPSCAGTFLIIVIDANGCVITQTVTVNQPTEFAITGVVTNVSCYGANDGSIFISVTGGGGGAYTYEWNVVPTEIEDHLTGLGPGTYQVEVTDGNGCSATASFEVTEPGALSVGATVSWYGSFNVSNFGAHDGWIDLYISGGTIPYYYTVNGEPPVMANSPVHLENLGAGTYTIIVTDANNCVAEITIVLTEPEFVLLTATIESYDVTCYGACDGWIDVSVIEGTPPFTFEWSNGETTEDIYGLCPGTYSVTISDALVGTGAINPIILTAVITEPDPISISAVVTDVDCYGNSTGAIDITVTGGTPPITFEWSNGATTEDLTDVPAGIYSFVAADDDCDGATDEDFVIIQPDPMTVSGNVHSVSCIGGNDGAIDLTVIGGVPPYYFWWSNGETTEDISGLTAGVYFVNVFDSHQCGVYAEFEVTEPTELTIDGTVIDVSCYGGNDGAIGISVNGGTPPYSVLWSNGSTDFAITGLLAGNYSVSVTDDDGCTDLETFSVQDPGVLEIEGMVFSVSCNGGSDGAIDITVSGGTLPYSYMWSTGEITEDLSGLTAGNYSVMVWDANGCTAEATFTVDQPNPLSISAVVTDVDCYGNSTGAIDITVTGGTPPYSYLWSNGATTEDINNLPAGIYSVQVTDDENCSGTDSFIIGQPDQMSVSGQVTNVSCYGGNDGEINLTVTGGVPPYYFWWSNGATTEDIDNLTAGVYFVNVFDSHQCGVYAEFEVTEPTELIIYGSVINVSCYGGNDGAIGISVNGGTPPYSVLWSNGENGFAISGLTAGLYSVTVTDMNNCTAEAEFFVTQPQPIVITGIVTDVSCYNGSDGAIDISVSGGAMPYSYLWSTGDISEDLSGLTAGNYTVMVWDSNGCITEAAFSVNQPGPMTVSGLVHDVSCNGGNDGDIDITVVGGVPPYYFYWSNGATTEDIGSLFAGVYSVNVFDSHQCSVYAEFLVTEPPPIAIAGNVTDVSCYGGNDGSIDLTVAGGVPPYHYIWSNGATDDDLSNLAAGVYIVTVIDVKGCEAIMYFEVTEPEEIIVIGEVTNVSCPGGSDGAIDITVYGGIWPYTFLWSNGAVSEDIFGLTIGEYTVNVTDANGCSVAVTFIVTEPEPILLYGDVHNVTCPGGSDGYIDLSVFGGVPPYNYLWSDGQNTEDIFGLTAGVYIVTVIDSHQCVAVASFEVTDPDPITIAGLVHNVTCYGGSDGYIDITVIGGTLPYFYMWSNGTTNEDPDNLTAGTYVVYVFDGNGCSESAEFVVSEPPELSLTYILTGISCSGGNTGAIDITVFGGTPPYSYQWSNGAATEDLINIGSGYYTVVVTDSHQCTLIMNFYIQPYNPMQLSAQVSNAICPNTPSGSIDLSVTGGNSPYTYLWSNGATTQDLTGIPEGNYTIHATDDVCVEEVQLTVGVNPPFTVTGIKNNVSCYGGSDGSIDITVTGTVPPLSYLWSNGATDEDLYGLSVGAYSVTVTQFWGCTATASFIISQPVTIVLSAVVTNLQCYGGNPNGSIDLSVQNNLPPYTYNWSNGASNQDIFNLGVGSYSVTVTNNHGCKAYATYSVTQPPPVTISFTVSNYNGYSVSYYGATNGSINTTVSGGTPPYTYTWNNGSHQSYRINIGAGTYSLIVVDSHGCTASGSVTLTQPPQLIITQIVKSNYNGYNVSCNGGTNGTAKAFPSGGVPPYTYNWSTSPVQNTQMATGLSAGSYTVIVKDANLITVTGSVTLTQPPALTALLVATSVSCSGMNNGSIDLTVNGGVVPYAYLWSNGAITQDIFNLAVGNYSVTITDANGCKLIKSKNVTMLSQMVCSFTKVNPTCNNDGSIDLTVTGGTSPYSYLWSNGATDQDLFNLIAGTYSVTVTSANGCTATGSTTLSGNGILAIYLNWDDLTCNGMSDGVIDLSVAGGVPPYAYLWSNGATTQDLYNLPAGTYDVTVTASNNCMKTGSVTITEPLAIDVELIGTNVSCYDGSDGTIATMVNGGVPPYIYLWSNGATNEYLMGIAAGEYSITVYDSYGCEQQASIIITQPEQLVISAQLTMLTCYESEDGEIDITVSGGTDPYSYFWTNLSTSEDLTDLSEGFYMVFVTDANGCTLTASYSITQPSEITTDITITNPVSCSGNNDASVHLEIAGGTYPYSILWSNSSTEEDLSGLSAGIYTVVVTDANNCNAYDTVVISAPPSLSITLFKTDATCYGYSDGSVGVVVYGGTYPYTFIWSDGTSVISNDENVNNLPAGTYYVTVIDDNGCYATGNITVLQNAQIVITITTTIAGSYATVQANVSGGVPPYTYLWSNGSTNFRLKAQLVGSTLSVTVTDSYGCTASLTFIVGSTPAPSMAPPVNNNNDIDAEITLSTNNLTPELSLNVYPNPNYTGIFNLEFGNTGSQRIDVQVFDEFGKLVYSQKIINPEDVNQIHLVEYSAGVYYLRIISENSCIISKKLIITQ